MGNIIIKQGDLLICNDDYESHGESPIKLEIQNIQNNFCNTKNKNTDLFRNCLFVVSNIEVRNFSLQQLESSIIWLHLKKVSDSTLWFSKIVIIQSEFVFNEITKEIKFDEEYLEYSNLSVMN